MTKRAAHFFALLVCVGAYVHTTHVQAGESANIQRIIDEKVRVSPDVLQRWQRLHTIDERRAFLDSLKVSRRAQAHAVKGYSVQSSFHDVAVNDVDEGSEIHAAINPTDSNNLVCSAISSDDAGQLALPLYYSKDFGYTWQKSDYAPAPDDMSAFVLGGGDPMFAYDAMGTLYYSWIDLFFSLSSSNPPMVIYWISSTDGGAQWQRNPGNDSISSGYLDFTNQEESPAVDKQWMVCDLSSSPGRNNLYTSLYLPYVGDQRVALRVKGANESEFRSSVTRPTRTDYSFNQFTSVDCDDEGRVHMSYIAALPSDSMPLGEFRLFHLLSTDQGASFQPEVEVSQVHFLNSSPGDPNSTEAPIGMSRIQALPQIACDKYSQSQYHGYVYLAWTAAGVDSRKTSGTDIYFSRSSDHGATWSTPVVVNDDKTADPSTTQAYVSVTVSPSGVVVLGWYDFRDDPTKKNGRYYMCYSFDGGHTFTKNFPVSSVATDFSVLEGNSAFGMGEYNQIVTSANVAIPFWGDARDGIRHVYCAHVPISPNIPADPVQSIEAVDEGLSVRAPEPNPATGDVRLQCTSNSDRVVELRILDLNAKVIQTFPNQPIANGQSTLSFSTAAIADGTYLVEIKSGHSHICHPLIVQH